MDGSALEVFVSSSFETWSRKPLRGPLRQF
jgi:hypothetical protein